jgi:hypothetical protein
MPVAAQQDPLAPEVTFPDVKVDGPIDPGRAVNVLANAEIECQPDQAPESQTRVDFAASGPSFTRVAMSPQTVTIPAQPEACADGGRHNVTTALLVQVESSAPAFESFAVDMAMNVTRGYPIGEANRTYGPYEAQASLETGFAPNVELTLDETRLALELGEQTSVEGSVENRANGQARVRLAASDVLEGVTVSISPEQVELVPDESRPFTATVATNETSVARGQLGVTIEATLTSTENPDARETMSDERLTLDMANGDGTEPASVDGESDSNLVPAPGLVPIAAIAGLAALRGRR